MGIMCVFGEGGWDGFVLRAVSYCTAGVCVAMWVPCPVRHGVRTYNRVELVSFQSHPLHRTEITREYRHHRIGQSAVRHLEVSYDGGVVRHPEVSYDGGVVRHPEVSYDGGVVRHLEVSYDGGVA